MVQGSALKPHLCIPITETTGARMYRGVAFMIHRLSGNGRCLAFLAKYQDAINRHDPKR